MIFLPTLAAKGTRRTKHTYYSIYSLWIHILSQIFGPDPGAYSTGPSPSSPYLVSFLRWQWIDWGTSSLSLVLDGSHWPEGAQEDLTRTCGVVTSQPCERQAPCRFGSFSEGCTELET